jgi:uncharacterized protein (DUF1800 family)
MLHSNHFIHWRRHGFKLALVMSLAAPMAGCDGPGSDVPGSDLPQNRFEAHRLLTEATFGTSEADMNEVGTVGYNQWIDDQLATQSEISYRAYYDARRGELGGLTQVDPLLEAFYTRALASKAQLRNRVALALSEIFVVSLLDSSVGGEPEMMAIYLDHLDKAIDGTYRDLLEAVSTSPAMGYYLTFLGNAKEDPSFGTTPDENFAREVMQLFSIGLVRLNPDGTPELDANGAPVESYTMADVKGLAKVFTGWSRNHGTAVATTDRKACFFVALTCKDVAGRYLAMTPFPEYHSLGEKSFLGVTIPASSTSNPQGDLKIALDTLANHPNTAPFISRQLIQRLVTSNPSPAYVKRVAAEFLATGGHIGKTVKAILLDGEARSLLAPSRGTFGKLKEPVLRMTAVLRAFGFQDARFSSSGNATNVAGGLSHVNIFKTSDASSSLGQTPFFAPSVFNFFRPGYVMPQSISSENGLVAPEFQLVNESSATGYVNFMVDMVTNGVPSTSSNNVVERGPTLDLTDEREAAASDATLIALVAQRMLGEKISEALSLAILNVLKSMPVPTSTGTQASIDARNAVLEQRLKAAILMVSVAPEFLIQR